MQIIRSSKLFMMVALVSVSLTAITACGNSGSKVVNQDALTFAATVADPGITVIDVRTPSEFAVGHIANAINVDVEASDFESQIAKFDRSKSYALYCHSGRRSGIASQKMSALGFSDVKNLVGGIIAWQNAGYPLVTN